MYAETVPGEMEAEIRSTIDCYQVTGSNRSAWLYNRFRYITPKQGRKAVEYIRELRPDIIHVHYGVDMLTFSGILEEVDIPVVVSFYGYDCTSFPKRFKGLGKFWLQKRVFSHKNLKAVFAMSPDMKKDLLAIGCPRELIRVHYYGSECKAFRFDRDYSEKETLTFTIISGLTAKKGHLVLLEAWQKFMESTRKKARLMIFGSGELEQEIKAFISGNNLCTVSLEGPVQYGSAAHHAALHRADVFVHPSRTAGNGDKEGIPGALIEAMANGLPVISTFHAGIPSVIENSVSGILVEENNIEQLSEALKLLAEDQVLREKLGRNASQYATSTLDVHSRETELEELYEEVINLT